MATALARLFSATYNYAFNYRLVFKSKESLAKTAIKYIILAIVQMAASALLVTIGARLLSVIPETIIKVVVDTILFFISYSIQQKMVFSKMKKH